MILLIGGAVLVTRSANEKVDALTADTPASAPEVELQSREVRTKGQDEDKPAPPVVMPADPVPEEPAPAKQVTAPKPDVGKPRGEKAKPKVKKSEDVGENEPDRHNRFEADAEVKPGFAGGAVKDSTVLETPAHKGPAPKADPSPPPALSIDEGDAVGRDDVAPTTTTTQKTPTAPKPKDPPKVTTQGAAKPTNEQLAKQAEALAAKGDCAGVREIVAQLRRNDETFYKQRLGKNAAVAKCF